MTGEGESEPVLIGPWTMGRDKKNPKPIDLRLVVEVADRRSGRALTTATGAEDTPAPIRQRVTRLR